MMEFVDAFRAASYQWACQKQMFFKIVIPKNFAIYTGKKPSLESLFNSVAGLKARNPIEKGLQRRCFPVNIAKCLGTTFFYRTPLVAASDLPFKEVFLYVNS